MDFDKYTDRSRGFIQSAQQLAQRDEHQFVGSDHLLKALLLDPEGLAAALILRAAGNPDGVMAAVDAALQKRPQVSGEAAGQPYLDRPLARVLATAEQAAEKAGDSYVTAERLLLALAIETSSEAGRILADAGVTAQSLNAVITALRKGRVAENQAAEETFEALRKYTRDLTQLAADGKLDPVFGRDDELRRAIQVLSRRSKNNPVLVGAPGVGKSAIINALAQRIAAGDVPEDLQHTRLLALDMGVLIAGSKYRGEFEERLKAVLDELKSSAGTCILLIDGMHTLISGGRSQSANEAAGLLKPAIDNGELQFIGTTTPDGFRTYIEGDEAFARRLQPIFVAEPSVDDTISILRTLKDRYEKHHRVRISDSALVAAATLSERYRYAANRCLPDKAIDLVDEAAARLKMRLDSKPYEIDDIEREIIRLKIQREALTREQDAGARAKLSAIETQLEPLERKCAELTLQWRSELGRQSEALKVKAELDQLRVEFASATRNADFQRAGEIKYARMPEVEKRLEALERGTTFFLQDSVAKYDVTHVISREIGIPVDEILGEETEADRTRKPGQMAHSGKIFISYRRDDVAGHAGRIHDRLRTVFGADLVFMDVDSIPFGADFVKALHESVEQCEVLLALIGPNWLDARDARGDRRLDDPNDFVRIEIATALQRDIQVIPILLPGTSMPRADQLPDDLRGLALRQALEVRHVSFQTDIDKLIDALRGRLGRPTPQRPLNA